MLAGNVDPEDCEPEPCEATWTAQHEKELKFVHGKHVRNLAEAIQNGTFLDADASDGELVKVATYMDKKRKQMRTMLRGSSDKRSETQTQDGAAWRTSGFTSMVEQMVWKRCALSCNGKT